MIKIAPYLTQCPKVWQNYINTVNPKGNITGKEVDEITLRDWRGVFFENDKGGGVVVFGTEGDELMFMLRWQ